MSYLLRSLIVYLGCKGKSYLKIHTQNNKYLKKFKTTNGSALGIGLISEFSSTDIIHNDYPHIKSAQRIRQLQASQQLCNQILGSRNQIVRDTIGRPHISESDLNISISHTRDQIGVIIGNQSVAVDIEQKDRSTDAIASKFTHEKELNEVKVVFPDNPGLFIWSCKECLFKAMRTEGVHFRENLTLRSISRNQNGFISQWNVQHSALTGVFKIESFIFEDLLISYIDASPT